eukprot:m.116145 g.116145  ORF g.116145 m.116145 type:complete len:185 (+) comp17166_c0_seq3:360-914(+)
MADLTLSDTLCTTAPGLDIGIHTDPLVSESLAPVDPLAKGVFFWYKEDSLDATQAPLRPIAEVVERCADSVTIRLYYLPEDTPRGRNVRHGKDEVLASWRSPKLPVDDAMQLIASEQGNGAVQVVTYRAYCRMKANQKRFHFVGDVGAQQPRPMTYFVRDDYRDMQLEARDATIGPAGASTSLQ